MKKVFILMSAVLALSLTVPYRVDGQKRIHITGAKSPQTPAGYAIVWVRTNFPSAVDTFTAHLAIGSSGHIFVGTDNGVYRSANNGATWTQVNSGISPDSSGKIGIFSLVIAPNGNVLVGIYDALYRSIDNGDHWIKIKSGITASALAVSSSGNIFAGDDSVYRSTDNGASWERLSNGLLHDGFDRNTVNSIVINSDGMILAGAFDGVYRSTDNGNNWKHVLGKGWDNNAGNLATNSEGAIFADLSSNARMDQGTEGLYRSIDNGDTWKRIIKHGGPQIPSFDGVWSIATTLPGKTFLGTRSGVYQSTNSGVSWTNISGGLVLSRGNSDKNVSAFAINADGIMFAVTPAGFFRSR